MTPIRLFFLSLLCFAALSTITAQVNNQAILTFKPGEMTEADVEKMLQSTGYPGEVIDKAEVFGLFLIEFENISFEGMDCDTVAAVLKRACPRCQSPTTSSPTGIQGGGGLNYRTSASFVQTKNPKPNPLSNPKEWLNSWGHLIEGGSKEGCPIKVAFLDSGIDSDHLGRTSCFGRTTTASIPQFPDPHDDNNEGHGTHTIGVAAQMVQNYPLISLLSIKTQNKEGDGTVWTAIKGLERALGIANPYFQQKEGNEDKEEQSDIVNMSLKYEPDCVGEYEQPMATAMRICMENYNMMIVTAAGNQEEDLNSHDTHIYPSKFNLPYQINVAALDHKGSLVSILNGYDWGTNHGNHYVDVALLGVDVPSYVLGTPDLDVRSGTSAATPQMTALVAILKSISCSEKNEAIIECIKGTVKPAESLQVSVNGYLQPEEALACAKQRFKIQGRIVKENTNNTFIIYPNPFNEALNLEINTNNETDITQCTLYNLTGQMIQKADFKGNINTTWDVENLPKGVYLLKIQQNDTQEIQKIIKQ